MMEDEILEKVLTKQQDGRRKRGRPKREDGSVSYTHLDVYKRQV